MARQRPNHAILVLAVLIGAFAACEASVPSRSATAVDYQALQPVELDLPGDPDWLAAGFGSVWVKRDDGTVTRLDEATADVQADIAADVTSQDLCQGIGAGSTGIWTCSGQDIVRIDPATDAVAATIAVGKTHPQGRLVSLAGRIWVLTGEGDGLVGVAGADGSLGPRIALPVECTDLAAGEAVLYVVCPASNQVIRVDVDGGRITAEATVAGPTQASVNASGLWVAGAEGIVQLDLVSLTQRTLVGGIVAGHFGSIWTDEASVYVRRISPFLTRIDATSGQVIQTVDAPHDRGGDMLAAGGFLWTSNPDLGLIVRLNELP